MPERATANPQVLWKNRQEEIKPQEKIGAIFVDWDNLSIPATHDTENEKDAFSSNLNWLILKALLEESLKFVEKAYLLVFTTESFLLRNPILEVDTEDLAIELIPLAARPNAADREIVARVKEITKKEAEAGEEISCFIFASGDGYFLPIIRELLALEKEAILMPYSGKNLNSKYQELPGIKTVFLKSHIQKTR